MLPCWTPRLQIKEWDVELILTTCALSFRYQQKSVDQEAVGCSIWNHKKILPCHVCSLSAWSAILFKTPVSLSMLLPSFIHCATLAHLHVLSFVTVAHSCIPTPSLPAALSSPSCSRWNGKDVSEHLTVRFTYSVVVPGSHSCAVPHKHTAIIYPPSPWLNTCTNELIHNLLFFITLERFHDLDIFVFIVNHSFYALETLTYAVIL